ncbi:conserved hypothetical protein [Uncinocarpus reesii 1704]|uniref:Integral membrane protein n=1 Tax=Uncinocarpus reesii (strain UAMH 1704) TaxID=336963 RepID=C4JSC9_UNCRE|nr:uncharacterized protein UREG_05368 [Uncinocarpus reesii 1704]EEP80526.1 conserved hypothetical protein [Uncinocarpus reesii 1704]
MDRIEHADDPVDASSNGAEIAHDRTPASVNAGNASRLAAPMNPPGRRPERRPSIRLMRLPNTQRLLVQAVPPGLDTRHGASQAPQPPETRRRSSSEPQRVPLDCLLDQNALSARRNAAPMSPLSEEPSRQRSHPNQHEQSLASEEPAQGVVLRPIENKHSTLGASRGRIRRMSSGARSMLGLNRVATHNGAIEVPSLPQGEYEAEVVNLLDVIDPEVSTITTLTNVQNSLFIPDLGNWVNRRPAYAITPGPSRGHAQIERPARPAEGEKPQKDGARPVLERTGTMDTITSTLSESRFAVLPDGVSLEGWSADDKRALNDHVRHMLHSRRSAFKRGLKGFIQYVKKPLGFLVTLYATLITLFGLAWVLFLIGWINVGGKQLYVINVIDYILVALFAIVGDGLAPFRAVDTYHMFFIARYHRLTYKLRRKQRLPKLRNKNDLPERREEELDADIDIEKAGDTSKTEDTAEFSVLTPKQQESLTHHAGKFAKSHTFYKPHETTTHHAFPLRILIAVVILLDFHSLFQIALGATTWGIDYRVRPFALTTVILCCSLSCNFAAGLLIWIGDRRTRKKDVIEKMFRQELTEQAITKLQKKKSKKKEQEEKERERKSQEESRVLGGRPSEERVLLK